MSNELKVGDTIPAGALVLLTQGSYSDYGVTGLFRAPMDTVVPGRATRFCKPGELEPDNSLLSTLLEEVQYLESWRDV